ncbi:MAG: HAMP domain-containing sensor histidine kinase [Solirubrobacteraceae bacterium]
MTARFASLRLWLLIAMIASAAVGLGAAVVLFRHVENSHERAADTAKALGEARFIATQAQAGADAAQLTALQGVLLNDQVTVVRGGRTIFRGPARPGREFELRVQAPFPGGLVRIVDYTSPAASTTLELTLITAGVLALVIAAAIVTATVVARAVRGPVGRAIDAAERVSRGELSARMGSSGPEELVKLGRAFDEMAARLERADRDQRQFLADVAHEIATPVNTVSGFALALADGAAHEPQQREEARALITTETGRLRDLLTDLRQLTHLDLAEGVRPAIVELQPFAQQLVTRFRQAAAAAGIRLTFAVAGTEVRTDPRLLEMIASNLLSNAIRYTPAGGHVTLRVRRRGDKLVLSVRDDGVGIAPEQQQRIFERLYRVDSTRDRATGGSGLGLAIAHRAAHNLGGHIELDSALGRGSEFRLVVAVGPNG